MSEPERDLEVKIEVDVSRTLPTTPDAGSQSFHAPGPDTTEGSLDSESLSSQIAHPSDQSNFKEQMEMLKEKLAELDQKKRELKEKKRELKETLKPAKTARTYFKGISPRIMHCFNTRNNILKSSGKEMVLPAEIIQNIIEICDPTTRVLVALTSKEMARHAATVEYRLKKKPTSVQPPKTELQRLVFLLKLKSWMGDKRGLCFQCLKYKRINTAAWVGKPNFRANPPRYQKERAAGPTCQSCFAKSMLEVHASRADIKRLKELIKKV